MGRHEVAKRRLRSSVAVVAVVVPAATLLTAGAGPSPPIAPIVPVVSAQSLCCADLVAAPPLGLGAAPASTRYIVSPAPPQPVAASTRAAERVVKHVLPVGVAPEVGLQIRTILAARAISAEFPEILSISGFRADPFIWHPHGLAIDVMIPDYQTPEGKELGDRVAAYALYNADRFELEHVIWRQVFYPRKGPPQWTAATGDPSADHFDHVHIATTGGGYPTGREIYFN